MIGYKKIMAPIMLIIAGMMLLVSCREESAEESVSGDLKVSILISPVGTRATVESVEEKIRSLRIIMLSDGFIEFNSKMDLSGTGSDAGTFMYIFERTTVPGNKKFYLIANEESVEELNFEDVETLPSGLEQGKPLGYFLDYYTKDRLPADGTYGYSTSGKGTEFESLLNSAYFTCDYTPRDGEIYLPYTAVYEGYAATDDQSVTIKTEMFLVPAAVKFTLNLYNYRREPVDVEQIELSKLNSKTFVMAQLDESELRKPLNNTTYYWIDWLKRVSDGTHRFDDESDLNAYNNKSGWISAYSLPSEENEEEVVSLEPGVADDWLLPKLTNKNEPPVLTLVRYYPESLNLETKSVYNNDTKQFEEQEVQTYYAQFRMKEIREGNIPVDTYESPLLEIDRLKSLFRATHVIVDVDIYEAMVEIYCQIAPWKVLTFQGYVKEEED